MIASHERQMAHARAVRARGSAMPPEGLPPGNILDSWVRCMHAGLDAAAAPRVPVVVAADLAQRRERSQFVRRLAQAQLETLSQQIAGSNFLLAFADVDGVILDLYADNRFSMSGSDAGIVAGSCWGETLCGTNGLGTALATGQPVAVTGMEHYLLKLGDISCTAAPVRDAQGDVVGVLDASSYFESRQRHTQALVQMAATHIEHGLLVHQMRSQFVLAIHPRAEYLGTLSAGLLAFDEGGSLMAVDARARGLLVGLEAARGTAFEALFCEPFELVLARLHVGHETRLRDALGSSLVATVVCRPPLRRAHSHTHAPARALPAARAAVPHAAPAAAPRTAPATSRSAIPSAAPFPAASGFVAADPAVAAACRLVQGAVRMQVPILICGETGTGKELLARHAHGSSGRHGEFVAVNCGALPDELFEAELFGYVGGAFTGARREGSIGLIASADGGTLLLDEVRELPLPLQAALLRFLDDRLVRPVGGTTARRVDVQLLAATNIELEEEVAARRFREDLLYRLNTVKVSLPPLRRRLDFDAAVHSVLAAVDAHASISAEAVARLALHGWPGNFRELRAVLTRALLARQSLADDGRLELADFEPLLPAVGSQAGSVLQQSATDLVLREFERCGRSVSRTSRGLGISRTTVYRHLRESGAGVSR
jgi:sigma-54 dependent transcriptional regulator, acetoin dehydrogenase operon transcriptional activator AcoR